MTKFATTEGFAVGDSLIIQRPEAARPEPVEVEKIEDKWTMTVRTLDGVFYLVGVSTVRERQHDGRI